ncbi:hypothetical protein HYDPIDRAFT_113302 [Hydnomerulius pinastri MD-312]|uniref:Unplaced genomic scaffold scaffold_17, whole genome shotgun sequence n=1 Tax=Hydnomerulius pinastri MD-312 TaxID=994086 RepID=A0A0C9WEH1_9AGAM|nr:hypothetical protein HYDPIDRAFT_113302 [Hydnomerulius pinastri MD-312]
MSPSNTGTCKVCSTPAEQRCSRCRQVWYCSADHQNADWKTHKAICTSPNGVGGIYFKAGENAPRLITVTLESSFVSDMFSGEEQEVKMPILPPLLGPGSYKESSYDALNITTMGQRGPALDQPFKLFIRDNFLNDGSPPNRIPALLTNGKAPHSWAGNLLALKETAPMSDKWVNCTMDDLPTLVKYFQWYGSRASEEESRAQILSMFPNAKIYGL